MIRLRLWAAGAAAVLSLLVVPVALADTCCGSATVTFDPPETVVGATVRLDGLTCETADAGDRMPLEALTGFWLTTLQRDAFLEDAARTDPATWPPFATVEDLAATVGSATVVVPDLPDGRYYLWWACGESGETGGVSQVLQWSEGPRLVVGSPASDCPAVPSTFEEFIALPSLMPMADVVECFSRTSITFDAYAGRPSGIGGTSNEIEPAWLGEPLDVELVLSARPDGDGIVLPAIRPGSGVVLPDGGYVRVTGHLDDEAALTCHGGHDPSDPAYQEPVQFCRERFVLTAAVAVRAPDTASAAETAGPAQGPDPRQPSAPVADLAILLGSAVAALTTIRRLGRIRVPD